MNKIEQINPKGTNSLLNGTNERLNTVARKCTRSSVVPEKRTT